MAVKHMLVVAGMVCLTSSVAWCQPPQQVNYRFPIGGTAEPNRVVTVYTVDTTVPYRSQGTVGTLQPIVLPPAASSNGSWTPSGVPSTLQAPVTPMPVVTYRPTVPVIAGRKPYYVGQGLLGQSKLYVEGQPVRNFLRSLSF